MDMQSAAQRVIDLPELLEMILLQLPPKTNCLRDLQFWPLERVNKRFRDTINRPGASFIRRILIPPTPCLTNDTATRMVVYKIPFFPTSVGHAQCIRVSPFVLRRHSNDHTLYRYDVDCSLDSRLLLRLAFPPNMYQLMTQNPSTLAAFVRLPAPTNVSWRRLPMLYRWIQAICSVRLPDYRERFGTPDPERQLHYRFYSNVNTGRQTIGRLADFLAVIRTFTEAEHVATWREAIRRRNERINAHRNLLRVLSEYEFTLEEKPLKCDICAFTLCIRGCLPSAKSWRELHWHNEYCGGYRWCGCRGSIETSICWPMDRDIFVSVSIIDE